MGKIDQSVKAYVKIPGIFTQLFNETFFDREHYIHPEDVSEQDSVTDVPLKGREMAERIRDVCMLSKSGMGFRIILGVEEQTDIHYYMPVRVMQLDAMQDESRGCQTAGNTISSRSRCAEGNRNLPCNDRGAICGRGQMGRSAGIV